MENRKYNFRFWNGTMMFYGYPSIIFDFNGKQIAMQSSEQTDDSVEADEIFEGDILYCAELDEYLDVFFQDGSYNILFNSELEFQVLTKQIIKANNLIVVGNIYENPELVELLKG